MPVNLKLHPEAKKHFSERADDLLKSVTLIVEGRDKCFSPDRHATIVIDPEQLINPLRRETVDTNRWVVTQIAFATDNGIVGLNEAACNELEKLTDSVQRVAQLRDLVSQRFVRTVILDWMEAKLHDSSELQFSEFLAEKVAASVEQLNVWVPIANLFLEDPVQIGEITLRSIDREFLDRWLNGILLRAAENEKKGIIERFEMKRSQLQGLAAACRTITAEPDYALAKCLQEAEEVVALLRCLHPANMSPRSCLYTRPLGSEGIETYQALFVDGDQVTELVQSIKDPYPDAIELGKEQIAGLQEDLSFINKLIGKPQKTEYQKDLLSALLLYSKNNVTRDISEKLVFIFAALESMLLRNETEPIQQNIADRMAFILGTSVAERRKIVALTKECYGFRSRYLHHGYRFSDEEVLQKFMMYVWVLFRRNFLHSHEDFATKEAMLNFVEDLKYSRGGEPSR